MERIRRAIKVIKMKIDKMDTKESGSDDDADETETEKGIKDKPQQH